MRCGQALASLAGMRVLILEAEMCAEKRVRLRGGALTAASWNSARSCTNSARSGPSNSYRSSAPPAASSFSRACTPPVIAISATTASSAVSAPQTGICRIHSAEDIGWKSTHVRGENSCDGGLVGDCRSESVVDEASSVVLGLHQLLRYSRCLRQPASTQGHTRLAEQISDPWSTLEYNTP